MTNSHSSPDRVEEHAREVQRLNDMLAEISMNGHQWMVAHDRLKAGKPYDLPKPADLPEALTVMREALERVSDKLYLIERDGHSIDNLSGRVRAIRETVRALLAKLSHGSVGYEN